MDSRQYLSQEKYDELMDELNYLKHTKRKEVAENLEHAKAMGDLSENAEYQEAREMQSTIEERIAKLEIIFKSAEIVSTRHSDTVGVGSTIKVQKQGEKDTRRLQMVGSEESDIVAGKISVQSPLGNSLVGKKKGDVVTFNSPAGKMTYKIISIE